MALIEINWQPTDRQLRQFALIGSIGLPAIGWFWGVGSTAMITLAAIGVCLAVVGWLLPMAVKPLFLALTLIATPIGIAVGELAMLAIYFGLFVPLGCLFRLSKKEAMQLRLDHSRESYWEPKKRPTDVGSYYRQG